MELISYFGRKEWKCDTATLLNTAFLSRCKLNKVVCNSSLKIYSEASQSVVPVKEKQTVVSWWFHRFGSSNWIALTQTLDSSSSNLSWGATEKLGEIA